MRSISGSEIKSARDIVLVRLDQRRILVVGCDATGAVGPKPVDVLRVDAATVGKFAARVALMETIAVGANPICLSVTLSVEPFPTGREIIRGIRRELTRSKLGYVRMVRSSEKNFPVQQTGVGVTVVGLVHDPKIGKCKRGDLVIAIGQPCVGREVLKGERTRSIADLADVHALLRLPFVHEIIPVGSKGVLKEARILATDSKLRFLPRKPVTLDMNKSAGPATVALCAISPSNRARLQEIIDKPLNPIGELIDIEHT